MSWYKHNGKVLKIDGAIATSQNCCCEVHCCGCEALDYAALLNLNLQVTVSGPVSGVCTMIKYGPGDSGLLCPRWEWVRGGPGQACDLTGCQDAYNLQQMFFLCPQGANNSNDYQFEAELSNLGCNFIDGNKSPIRGQVAWTPEEFFCPPNAEDYADFYAKFRFPTHSTFGLNGCACSTADFVFEIRFV